MGPTRVARGVEPRRRARDRRVAVRVSAVVVAVALVAAVIVVVATHGKKRAAPSACRVTARTAIYSIEPAQAANATTIAAVGKRLALPDHAVTIALATALQESQLRNLPYGDRDSIGLFQQRPSQGWGSRAQIMQPDYAAGKFFEALEQIHGWQAMSVTDAAQAVQHSDAPEAYATWEPLARALAIAATGEKAAGLACEFTLARSPIPSPSPAPALKQQLGSSPIAVPISPTRGWTVAAWLVGHAEQYRIASVRYGGREWTPDGSWRRIGTTAIGVRITQAPPGS